jgi:hypothetical protein
MARVSRQHAGWRSERLNKEAHMNVSSIGSVQAAAVPQQVRPQQVRPKEGTKAEEKKETAQQEAAEGHGSVGGKLDVSA